MTNNLQLGNFILSSTKYCREYLSILPLTDPFPCLFYRIQKTVFNCSTPCRWIQNQNHTYKLLRVYDERTPILQRSSGMPIISSNMFKLVCWR